MTGSSEVPLKVTGSNPGLDQLSFPEEDVDQLVDGNGISRVPSNSCDGASL